VELRAFPKAPVALAVPGADYSRGAGLEHRTADMWVEVRAFRPVAPVVEELMGSGSADSGSDNLLVGPPAEASAYQSAALPLPVVGQADRTGYSAVGWDSLHAGRWVEVSAFRSAAPLVPVVAGQADRSGYSALGDSGFLHAGHWAEVSAFRSAAPLVPVAAGRADHSGYSAVAGSDSLRAVRSAGVWAHRSVALPALEVGRQPAGRMNDSPAAGSDNPVARRYSGRRAGPLDLAASRPKAGIGFPGEEPLPYDRGAFSWFPLAELAAAADALRVSR
jgi:hypothetical protein